MIEAPPRLLDLDTRRSKAWQSGAIAAVLSVCALVNPDRPFPLEVCGFRLLTGLPCPTCGLTRALCHALHGNWAQSVASHPAGLILAAGLVGWMLWSAAEAFSGRPLRDGVRGRVAMVLIGAGAVVSVGFWIGQLVGRS